MCVICASAIGVKKPTEETIRQMFKSNPHGAGYMYSRNGEVVISKGFMDVEDYIKAIKNEHFSEEDSVVYHCRISTQAGVNPQMTHPFPLTNNLMYMEQLDLACPLGIAHNGIIRMTSTNDKRYSDTALFIVDYMTKLIRNKEDLYDMSVLDMIEELTDSKWAFLTNDGDIITVGRWIKDNGNLYSNSTYRLVEKQYRFFEFD